MYNVPPEIEIYSTNSGVWRRLMGIEIKHFMVEFTWPHAFVNGVVHWIAYDLVPSGSGFRSLLISFSIVDEVLGEIMLPDAIVGVFPTNLSITLFEESIVVVKYEWEIDGDSCEVWVMKQYGVFESWSRLYRINFIDGMERVVGFKNNSEVLFSTRNNGLVSYDPNSRPNRVLNIQGSSRSFYVQNYMESLILLNCWTTEFMDAIKKSVIRRKRKQEAHMWIFIQGPEGKKTNHNQSKIQISRKESYFKSPPNQQLTMNGSTLYKEESSTKKERI